MKLVFTAALLSLSLLTVVAQAQVVVPDDGAGKTARYSRTQSTTLDEAMDAFNSGDVETAAKEFYRLAPNGDPQAQFYLAYMMEKGMGTPKNIYSAVSWYKSAADQDYLPAVAYMGYIYSTGHGVNKDDKEAFKWYTRAAQMGSADAQNALGTMLRDGRGYKKDSQLATQWFLQAALQGNARAQSNLATMYFLGHGVKANLAEALHWYMLAAQKGDVYALGALGALYRTGEGVDKDPVKALEYYSQAAQAGYVPAELALAGMYETGEGDKTKGPTDAAIWYARAAKKGDAGAEERLGYYYENGFGLPQDIPAAISWYNKAIDGNSSMTAMLALGKLYELGKGGTPPDFNKAVALYRKCAGAGEPRCQWELGRLYREGKGVGQDLVQAYVWMALAAENFPEGEDKSNAVVARIEISNSLSEDQLNTARHSISTWKPVPVLQQRR